MTADRTSTAIHDVDVVVVGAGFAGVYAVHRAREAGFSVIGLEAGSDVGGTWYWNRYPGARVDVESLDYSYSFSDEIQQEWRWTERYAAQPEILSYIRFVADRLNVRDLFQFHTRVTSARYDADAPGWAIATDTGVRVRARRILWATGPLSVPLEPNIPGIEEFRGRVFHSGRWPHEPVDFSGRRVASIGTGSSGIQMTPQLAKLADQLFVLQRTANFSIPAHNYDFDDEYLRDAMAGYAERRKMAWNSPGGSTSRSSGFKTFDVDADTRREIFEHAWSVGGGRFQMTFDDQLTDAAANAEAVEFVHEKIRSTVKDPVVAERLLPRNHGIGARRICVDIDYYETFNRDNVTLVDVPQSGISACATGLIVDGELIEVDDIVLATGFDAMTGALLAIDIVGRDGLRLADAWAAGPVNYLGLAVHGFPDMLILNGPGSPSVFANMVLTSEHQVDWATDLLRSVGEETFEAQAEPQAEWVQRVAQAASHLLAGKSSSWYLGSNVPGKPRVFLPFAGGFDTYQAACNQVAEDGYAGFDIR